MESKYYRPDISDLFIGYEFEQYSEGRPGYPEWLPNCKIEDEDAFGYILRKEWIIRTPYLTREQIEKDGWSFNKDNYGSLEFSKWDYEMSYRPVTRMLNLIKGDSKPPTELYYGKCPSINEFRKICKLVI